MSRKIILDTETTGLSVDAGERIIEIGCVELLHNKPTMKDFHVYVNPCKAVSEGAFRVHGISDKFLSDKPKFADIADDFLKFIGDATLVIHNADFDMRFLNNELKLLNRPTLTNPVIDTVKVAKEKFPTKRVNLDALCAHFNLSLDQRKANGHGALLDAKLLTQVYLNLISDMQIDQMSIVQTAHDSNFKTEMKIANTDEELLAYNAFCANL